MANLVKFGLVASCVFVTACSTPHNPQWVKPNVTPYERQNTISRCKYEIGMNNSVQDNSEKARNLFRQCMQKEGYRYL